MALRRARPARGCEGEVELRREAAEARQDSWEVPVVFLRTSFFQ